MRRKNPSECASFQSNNVQSFSGGINVRACRRASARQIRGYKRLMTTPVGSKDVFAATFAADTEVSLRSAGANSMACAVPIFCMSLRARAAVASLARLTRLPAAHH